MLYNFYGNAGSHFVNVGKKQLFLASLHIGTKFSFFYVLRCKLNEWAVNNLLKCVV